MDPADRGGDLRAGSGQPPAVSRQFRMLRRLGLEGTLYGKTTVCALCDDRVARLLDESVCHGEHLCQ